MRLTDGQQRKTDTPVIRIRAFQLTDKEACIEPDVVTGMFSSPLLLFYVIYDIYVYVLCVV